MRALAAVRAEDHAHGERRPVFVRAQRAEVVGDALGQHRHDAVGEIDRIAALQRLAVERRARPHIGRDVGDGDRDDEAAAIVRIGVGRGMDGVVVILGVGRIDGDERQLAPVLARRRQAGRARGLRPRSSARRREDMRDVMGRERDEADRPLGLDRAERLDDAGRRRRRSRPSRNGSSATRSPSSASPRHAGGHEEFAARARFSTGRRGRSRPRPCGRRRSTRAFSLSRILTTRPE